MAKGGKRRLTSVVDPMVYDVVAALKQRRGGLPELLAWRRRVGRKVEWVDVRSTDINAYIKHVTGGDFTAKDFRTWNATVLAAVALARVDRGGLALRPQAGRHPGLSRRSPTTSATRRRCAASPTSTPGWSTTTRPGPPSPPPSSPSGRPDDLDDLATHGLVESAVLDLLDPLVDVTQDLEAIPA